MDIKNVIQMLMLKRMRGLHMLRGFLLLVYRLFF